MAGNYYYWYKNHYRMTMWLMFTDYETGQKIPALCSWVFLYYSVFHLFPTPQNGLFRGTRRGPLWFHPPELQQLHFLGL